MPLETLQNGRYRILRTLGSGSMGEVYLVEDRRINRQVAIKVIRIEADPYPDSDTGKDLVRLFEREAKAIARLNHPNILPLFDFGEEVVNGTPLTYMVMPYSPEGSLATWLQQRGPSQPLSPSEVAHFLRQAADALQHAHDNDIIHQDVKPQNFLIRSNKNAMLPDLLLADFGIAKLAVGTSGASQAIRGTPIYMAPEQWEGNPVPASDQYALAIMIYQLLVGRPPFQGGPGQMMYQHLNVSPQPPSTFNPAISPDVDAVILHALAKKPENRFPSVSAFSNAFQQALLTGATTIARPQNMPQEEGIHATLAISPEEALHGTSRTLTLAGGRRVRAAIPAGAQNGQVIRAMGLDPSNPDGSASIPLLLTIAVTRSGESLPTILTNDEQTIAGGLPTVAPDGGRTTSSRNPATSPGSGRTTVSNFSTVLSSTGGPAPVPPVYYDSTSPVPPPGNGAPPGSEQRRRRRGASLLLILLALILILGGAGFTYYYFAATSSNASNANATATAQANNNTATSQNNGTALANRDTATANAQANATTTATQSNANATATANAQANANATATAQAAVSPTPTPTPFTVQSITVSVNPSSVDGYACGTSITVTYTATFVVASHSPGGTVQFMYTVNNGQSSQNASLTFGAGETTKTYTFTWSGTLPDDHTYPGIGEITASSPNQVKSNGAQPSGQCNTVTPTPT
jgi:eukaryotic-like serine/threonine-protein kinase